MESQDPKRLLAAIPDLFFGSKVAGVARRLGLDIEFVGSRAALVERARSGADMILIDLDAVGIDPMESIRDLRAIACPRIVAFASHVHAARLEEARTLGCDEVLTRGGLASSLPALLAPLRSRQE